MADTPEPSTPSAPVGVPHQQGDRPYQALYRRYRPQRFADVRGQEHVTRALCNAVRDSRVAHAYLFSGPRGTGKTSTARILAMALNCESPVDGEPDGTCLSCQSVRSGASMDVFELDAASNRKLEEMRDLLSRVALGTPGRWKVYIIDEVHQLTSDASSALLKTLEEPPAHVVFVLATTDPQKVLATIRSRTQHFEFRLLDGTLLVDLLGGINQDAGLGLSEQAIRLAVERGRGSARDAESALEQLAATGGEEGPASPVPGVVAALAARDIGGVLEAVAGAIATGREPRRLGGEIVSYLRDGFLSQQAPSLVLLPAGEVAVMAQHAQSMGLALLVRSMEVIGQALVDMRDSVDPRVTLEVALMRLAAPAASNSAEQLAERLERLESLVAGGGATLPAQVARPPATGTGATSGSGPDRASHAGAGGGVEPRGVSPLADTGAKAAVAGAGPASAEHRPVPASQAAGAPDRAGGATKEQPGDSARPEGQQASATPGPTAAHPTGPAQARVALGAILRAGGQSPAAPPRQAAATPGPAAATPGPTGAPPAPGTPAATGARPVETPAVGRPAPGGDAGRPPGEDSGSSGQAPRSGERPAGAGLPAGGLPTRDQLTKAWGDQVLGSLHRRAQVYMASGRFTQVDNGTAVFALPDAGLVSRAQEFVGDAERALEAHFGARVALKLTIDKGAGAPQPVEETPAAPAEERYDLDDLEGLTDAGPAASVPAEQRILDAFPGAVVEE